MHFHPLEEIAENLEESVKRNRNLALFNRLLSSAPSPTGFMGGALRRTSAQLQRLTRPVSPDPSFSDEEAEREESMGRSVGTVGSTPSLLGLDTTQSTTCSCGGLINTHPPLSAVEFNKQEGEERDQNCFKTSEEENKAATRLEKESLVPKIPPPTLQTSTGRNQQRQHQPPTTAHQSLLALDQDKPHIFSTSPNNRSVPGDVSFQLINDQGKVMTPNAKAESVVSLLTLPSLEVLAISDDFERELMVAD